jgi:dTDP-glucose pyrophosphorylase
MSLWKGATVQDDASLRDAVMAMDACGLRIVLVVDAEMRLIGLLTDGDVRRALLRGAELDTPVQKAMNRGPRTAPAPVSRSSAVAIMRAANIAHLPVVDGFGRLIGLEMLFSEEQEIDSDYCAVIMAGGAGKRLSPLTDRVPKPLLKVGDRPILQRIIESLVEHGFKRLFVAVNYKAGMIKEFCGDGARWGVDIAYLEEQEPRGTAGALALLPEKLGCRCVVVNGDILTGIDYRALIEFHEQQNNPATICVREQRTQFQYGVIQFDGPFVSDIIEKPYHSCFINAGIYVLDERGLALVPKHGYFDMPSLFKRIVSQGHRAAAFPIREFWLDIGTHTDFEAAQRTLPENIRSGLRQARGGPFVQDSNARTSQVIQLRP